MHKPAWLKSSIAGKSQPKKPPAPGQKKKKRAKMIAHPGPGYEDRFELGSRWIENPFPDQENPKIEAQINIRHDLLIHWRARRSIDDAQYIAGHRLQAIWYRAGIGTPGAIRYDKDKVDISEGADPIADRVVAATNELREIAAYLGRADYRLVTALVCEGKQLLDFGSNEVERKYISRRVRDALGYLADHWGATGKARSRIRVEHYADVNF